MALQNTEAPNTLLSISNLWLLDLLGAGMISGFPYKSDTYGADPLLSTFYDDVPVRNLDGSYNFNISGSGFSFNWTQGDSSQTGIAGFQKVETLIPLSSNTRIANPTEGAGPYKVVTASFTSTMFPDADTIKVTVRIPALYSQDDQGNTNAFELSYAVDLSLNNGRYVEQEVVKIQGKCTQPYLQTRTYVLPKTTPVSSFSEWKVRVRRVSTNILSVRTANDIFVDSISVVSASMFGYPNSALAGTTISADNFAAIPSRSYELCGLLMSVPNGYTPTSYLDNVPISFNRQCEIDEGNKHIPMTTQALSQLANIIVGTQVSGPGIPDGSVVTAVNIGGPYFFTIDQDPTASSSNSTVSFISPTLTTQITPASYPTVWTGDFQTGVWTDNPAWVFYDLLTNPVHGLGDIVQTESVDKWTLYQIAQYCDQMVDDGAGGLEPQFTCNVNITQADQAYSVLLNLASTFRGMLYYSNGSIHATQTSVQSPVYAFTNANVVDGVFSYSDTAQNTRATVAKVKWVDPTNQYRENVVYVEDIEGIRRYGYQEKEMSAFACTSPGQAYRLGSWTLQTERLLTETVTFQTSLEGLYIQPGDVFGVYDNFRNNRSQGGRIAAINAGRSLVTLDRSVVLDPGVTYSLTAIVPKALFNGPTDVTGSDQIPLIHESQIESFRVINSAGVNASLTVAGQFSTGIYIGSPWVLSSSGDPTGIFRSASFYTCLATSEIEPGKIEVLGLQANTGINFVISTGYTVVDNPPNSGDRSSVQPPTNLSASWLTGSRDDNSYYSNILLSWTPSPSTNVGSYILSGQTFGFGYSGFTVMGNGYSFPQDATGQYNFKVAAVSYGGVRSSYASTSITIQSTNPFGQKTPLSGVFIYKDPDPNFSNAAGFSTGFIGSRPGLQWNIQQDVRGYDVPWSELITGYRIRMSGLAGGDLLTQSAIYVSGVDTNQYIFPDRFLYTGLIGGATRGVHFVVEPLDEFGGVVSGANLKINNPAPQVPLDSGFIGFNGGLSYNVTPNPLDDDITGVYLWMNTSPTFIPTFSNYDYNSDNLAGFAKNSMNGSYWSWFSLVDTFGPTGCAIYGPISGNSNAIFQTFQFDISSQISGAFDLLTGMITQETIARTGADYQNLLLINGLSGQVTGLPGLVNTALNVRVDQATASSSGALSTQINAVSARVQLTGQTISATVGTLQSALATTGGALASWITNLGAVTSGASASVQIGSQAFVTGGSNGLGGAAVATWGFNLNANGKVVSMHATSSSWGGVEYGVIAFSGATLQSETYVKGSKGWSIDPSGNAEFGSAIIRGTFTGGAAGGNQVVMDPLNGFRVGTAGADRVVINAPVNNHQMVFYNQAGQNVAILGTANLGAGNNPGIFELFDTNGNQTIQMVGLNGTATFNGMVSIAGASKLEFTNAGTDISYLKEDWGVNLYGDANHPIHVRGASFVRAGTAGGSFGTQNILNWTIDFNPDTSWSDGILPNTFECATVGGSDHAFSTYLKLRGPGGTTIYVPYQTSAP